MLVFDKRAWASSCSSEAFKTSATLLSNRTCVNCCRHFARETDAATGCDLYGRWLEREDLHPVLVVINVDKHLKGVQKYFL
jgi:hypothetical protein